MTHNAFIDIETVGKCPGNAIISIGAVRFDDRGVLHDRMQGEHMADLKYRFYREISVSSNMGFGLGMDPDTVAWWLKKDPDIRKTFENALTGHEVVHLGQALADLQAWLKTGEKVDETWCYGASFDFPFLQYAYVKLGGDVPWDYTKLRCARTLFAAVPLVRPDSVGAHNALNDATRDARHTAACLRWLTQARQLVQQAEHEAFLRQSGLQTLTPGNQVQVSLTDPAHVVGQDVLWGQAAYEQEWAQEQPKTQTQLDQEFLDSRGAPANQQVTMSFDNEVQQEPADVGVDAAVGDQGTQVQPVARGGVVAAAQGIAADDSEGGHHD